MATTELSEFCGAPQSVCKGNCDSCTGTIHKKLAMKRREEGRKVIDEIKPPRLRSGS